VLSFLHSERSVLRELRACLELRRKTITHSNLSKGDQLRGAESYLLFSCWYLHQSMINWIHRLYYLVYYRVFWNFQKSQDDASFSGLFWVQEMESPSGTSVAAKRHMIAHSIFEFPNELSCSDEHLPGDTSWIDYICMFFGVWEVSEWQEITF